MNLPNSDTKRYTLLRRANEGAGRGPSGATRPGVRRLTLVRRAQLWPPRPGSDGR